jgi:hypothetical protein
MLKTPGAGHFYFFIFRSDKMSGSYYWRIYVGIYALKNMSVMLGKKTTDIHDEGDGVRAKAAGLRKAEKGLRNPELYHARVLGAVKMPSASSEDNPWARLPEFRD